LEEETKSLDILQASVSTASKQITRSDITELKSFANPPEIIQKVITCMAAALNEKPDWTIARNVDSFD
jgi:hypothetical protein